MMANASDATCPLYETKSTLDPSCLASASSYLEYITTLSSQSTNPSSTTLFLTSMSNDKKVLEDEIEQSKVHWSQLVEHLEFNDDEVAEVSNVKFFKSLQKHPTCSHFFRTFGDGGIFDVGKLEVGEKFAEGGQAEVYHAHVTWKSLKQNSFYQQHGYKVVLKVFKKGMFLRDLQKQWPLGMFKAYEEENKYQNQGKSRLEFTCRIICGTLLQDGRFAFLMMRAREDLRTLINRKMKERTCLDFGPFPMEMAFKMIYHIARGMDWLHNLNIVHRDLKASNVLCGEYSYNNDIFLTGFVIADYECSIGVVGTGFFRAPEILQAIKDKVVSKRPEVFTKAGDVYGYGMVCYEILTGKLPFQGHPLRDYDLVLQGQKLELPHHIDEWIHDLLHRCWQLDALARPSFQEIVEVLEANSKDCKEFRRFSEEFDNLPSEEQIYKFEF